MPNPCAKARDRLWNQCSALVGFGLPRDDRTGMLAHSGVFVWVGSQVFIVTSFSVPASARSSKHNASRAGPEQKTL